MWIETDRFTSTGRPVEPRRRVRGEDIHFSSNGKAQVPREIGEAAISKYPDVTEVSTDEE